MSLSEQILNLVFEIRNVIALPDETNLQSEILKIRAQQLEKIDSFIRDGKPVHMILPAFPAKSPNPQKTVTNRPDYGEVLALKKLQSLCEHIQNIYPAGAHITICSDGRVFSDVVEVSDGAVDVYGREIKEILRDHDLTHLSTFSLDDVFSSHNYDLMRQRLTTEFAEPVATIRQRTLKDAEARSMFNGIHRFMFEDQTALYPEKSRTSLREHAKDLAYEVIRRSNAWSRLVEKKFANSLRLSIHPQPLHSIKIGIRLLPSSDLWRTPWHSVTVFDGHDYYLAPRSQVEAAGGVLTYAAEKYPYYFLPTSQAAMEAL
ncbi:isocyanide synthase family protein [Bdellovibrio bacteriovorus]|uniref:isocyanide synthase family protein n=1 Tax=Bdellovibrio bacteriovorus TaxID=959 RepID=UPI0021D1307D|nr:isocyanide synthase family protein [Bdellovibrio bacteriovorus]UXR65303.1 isocyanide synthase family protein [Bdellovibrio bacteriovorus]